MIMGSKRFSNIKGDDFDVVESEPDEVESSSDEEVTPTVNKETKEQKRINKRLKDIREV